MARAKHLVGRLALLAACLFLSAALIGCGPLLDPSAMQERVAVPAERLSAGSQLTQTFAASRDRLTAVDLLLAVYPAGNGDTSGELVVHLQKAQGSVDLGTLRLPVDGLQHNGRYRLNVPPQPHSAGQTYRVVVESTSAGPARATPWRTDDDAYANGTLSLNGNLVAGDLAFRAYYDYDPLWLAPDLAAAVPSGAWVLLVALALLLLPGMALQRLLLRGWGLDAAESVGMWLGLSIAFWAVLLLLVTVAGLRLGGVSVVGILVLAALVSVWRGSRNGQSRQGKRQTQGKRFLAPAGARNDRSASRAEASSADLSFRAPPGRGEESLALAGPSFETVSPDTPASVQSWPAASWLRRLGQVVWSPAGGAYLVALGALALRFLHAKDLAVPMWVDSVHHTLIADLIAQTGQVPADYGPLLATQPMNYHFGFHVLVAALAWLTGVDIAQGVLFTGQLLGGMVVFSTYLLASRLSGDRRAGLVAALVVGLVSTLPAYYVSWGRYPQLAGLIVLPTAALLCTRLAAAEPSRGVMPLAALALAGQVLVHPRVALLLAAYVAAYLLVKMVSDRPRFRGLVRLSLVYGGLAVLTGVVLAPWLLRLAGSRPASALVGDQVPAVPFDFPLGVITGGTDAYLLAGALVAVPVLGIALRRLYVWAVVGWVIIALGMANTHQLGLPVYLFLSNHALAIALFLPIAVLDGALVAVGLAWLKVDSWPRGARVLSVVAALAVGVWGGGQLVGIVNPGCILATAADVAALRWVADNTSADAFFYVNARRWQGTTSAGSDGGYWLSTLAKRRSTMPPLIYTTADAASVSHVEAFADSISLQPPTDAAALHQRLVAEGVTHVYIGALGGPVHRDLLENAPGFRELYDKGGVAVFAVLP